MRFFISTTAEQLGVILSIPGRRVSTDDPPARRRGGGRNAQLTVDVMSGRARTARGECSSARALSLARSSGAGHRESGDWRGASCGERRRCPRTAGYRTTITHTHSRPSQRLAGRLATCVSSAFPFPKRRRETVGEGERAGMSSRVRELIYTHALRYYTRVHAAERLSATNRSDMLANVSRSWIPGRDIPA